MGTTRVYLHTTSPFSGRTAIMPPFPEPKGMNTNPCPTTGRVPAECESLSSMRQSSSPVAGSYP